MRNPKFRDMAKAIYFIDARVDDRELVQSALPEDAVYVVLSGETDGVLQIRQALSDYRELDAVHVISHGASGALYLGSTVHDARNI